MSLAMLAVSIAEFELELTDFTPWEQAAYARSYLHSFRHIAGFAGYLEDPLVLSCAGLSMRECIKTHLEYLAADRLI